MTAVGAAVEIPRLPKDRTTKGSGILRTVVLEKSTGVVDTAAVALVLSVGHCSTGPCIPHGDICSFTDCLDIDSLVHQQH